MEKCCKLFANSQSYLRKRKIQGKYLQHLIWPNEGCEHYRTSYSKNRKIHIKSRHAASYPPRKTAKLKTGNAAGNNKGGVKEGLACESQISEVTIRSPIPKKLYDFTRDPRFKIKRGATAATRWKEKHSGFETSAAFSKRLR